MQSLSFSRTPLPLPKNGESTTKHSGDFIYTICLSSDVDFASTGSQILCSSNNFLMGADRLRASELCVQYRVDCLAFWDRSFELSLDVDLASTRSQIPSPQIILSRNHHSLERLDSDNFRSIILFSQRTTTSRGTYNVMA